MEALKGKEGGWAEGITARAATIAAIPGATLAAAIAFAITWLGPEWRLSGTVETLLVILFVASLAILGLSVAAALSALLRRDPAGAEKTLKRLQQAHWTLLAGIALVLIQAAVFAIAAAPVAEGSPSSEDEISRSEEAESAAERAATVDPLARQFAPVVWIHRREAFGPSSVPDFLSRSELTWRTKSRFRKDEDLAERGSIEAARLGLGCARTVANCYRRGDFLATDFTRPHDKRPARPAGLDEGEGFYIDPESGARQGETGVAVRAPMYYEIRRGKTTRITYWFFYGYSRPFKPFGPANVAALFSHEGDWENVDVVVGADGTPLSVYFYGHGHPHPVAWSEVCKIAAEGEDCDSSAPGRPVVYSALSSHASYPSEAEGKTEQTKVCAAKPFQGLCSYDMRNRGYIWDPLAAQGGGLQDAQAKPWYGFGGAWGSAGSLSDTTGPLGPSPFKLSNESEPGEMKAVVPPAAPGG